METTKSKVNLAILLLAAGLLIFCPGVGMAAEIFVLNQQESDLSAMGQEGTDSSKQPSHRVDIVWAEFSDSHNEIFYQRFNAGGWADTIQITDDQNENVAPSISVSDAGVAWIVWSAYQGSSAQLYCLTCNQEMSCSEPQKIPSFFLSNTGPSVAIDNSGKPWLAWSASSGREADGIVCSRWDGYRWSRPERISKKDDFPDVLPIIGLDQRGLPWVYWSGFDGQRYRKYFSSWEGSTWSPEILLGDQNEIQRQCLEKLTYLPPFPDFSSDPHKISVYIDGNTSIQSLPVKLLQK